MSRPGSLAARPVASRCAHGGDGPERHRLEAVRQLGGLRPGWFYVGRRPRTTEVFVVSAATVERLEHRAYRSRTALDWGAESDWTGCLELSYARQ